MPLSFSLLACKMKINFVSLHLLVSAQDIRGMSGGAAGSAPGGSGGATHIFRSLSSESQKREWSKQLSLRGMRHGGGGGSGAGGAAGAAPGLASSKEVS